MLLTSNTANTSNKHVNTNNKHNDRDNVNNSIKALEYNSYSALTRI